MKKIIPFLLGGLAVVVLLVVAGMYVLRKTDANKDPQARIETPPTVSKVNALPLAQQPYVALVPHANADTSVGCNGVDLIIENLKNGEKGTEYELEYTTTKLIQGVFGRREFSQKAEDFKPLEFGTCSKGRCKCDGDITGGSLKLTFTGTEEYILKGDFTVQNVGEKEGKLNSKDGRILVNVGDALPKTTDVLIMPTFGLPAELSSKVLVKPYGIFAEGVKTLKKPITVTLQSQDVSKGKIQFWDGTKWQPIEAKTDGDKATFELASLGTIVLTE